MSNALDWLWYANILGFSASNSGHVYSLYNTPEKLMKSGEYARNVLTPLQYQTLLETTPEMLSGTLRDCERLGVKILTPENEYYPQSLLKSDVMPPVLYYRGDITLLTSMLSFAIIGTRRPSAYGVEATRKIARELSANGAVLVSGLATGLDSEAHKAAISQNAPTIACLAFGHDICYPAANRTLKELIEKTGLTISEFPPGTNIHKAYFLNRNRIIAAISRGVCVAEARKASGTMNTVAHALSLGRDVFSVPGSIFSPLSEGTNALLSEGAILCTCAQDILNYYSLEYHKENNVDNTPPPIIVSKNAANLFKALSPLPKTAEQLSIQSNLKLGQTMAALTELELCGAARALSGRRFELAIHMQTGANAPTSEDEPNEE